MKSLRQLEIEEDIRTRCTGMMTFTDVSKELGTTYKVTVNRFLEDLPVYMIEGKRRWRIADIAKRLADMEV